MITFSKEAVLFGLIISFVISFACGSYLSVTKGDWSNLGYALFGWMIAGFIFIGMALVMKYARGGK